MTTETFREMALAFPGTEEAPHFERRAFRVVKKRIFATLHEASRSANLRFTPAEQADFCTLHPTSIFPVPNKWGLQGWTTFDLKQLPEEVVQAALEVAYERVVSGGKPPLKG